MPPNTLSPLFDMPPTGPAPVETAVLMPAPLLLRFINWVIDRALSLMSAFLLPVIGLLVYEIISKHHVQTSGLLNMLFFAAAYLLVQFIYYFLGEWLFGRTFGKALTGTQVVTPDGGRPRSSQIAVRTICRAIPFEEITIFFNNHLAIHDTIPGTMVVRSQDLPESQRRNGWIMKLIAGLLVLCLAAGLIGWPIFEQVTGGKRIELPAHMPEDLHLTDYREVHTKNNSYYVLTYSGKDRTVTVDRMIAGYDFDPDNKCMYMTPTKTGDYGYDATDPSLECTEIGHDAHSSATAYKVTAQTADTSILERTPDYYLNKPPYRYALKSKGAKLTDAEVTAMITGGYVTYTASQLRQQAGKD